jgi:membrane-bound ClpP family serine protease
MHINSGGGSVFAGMAIYNLLRNYEGEVVTYVDGRAASIASVIALAGDKIIMRTGSCMMIHKPAYCLWGAYNADDFRKLADDLDEIQKAIMQVYRENKAKDADINEIENMVNEETWMTSEEVIKHFDRVEIENLEAVAMASSDFIAHYARKDPPQFAQGKPDDKEDINAAREMRAREIEILEMEERK